jgi:hypothetical protein
MQGDWDSLYFRCLSLLAMTGLGQRFRFQEQEEEGPRPVFPLPQAEFHFVRAEYTDLPEYHRFFGFASRGARGEGWWVVDWPDADDHFSQGVERLTRIATGDPRHMRFTDDRLFDYPWVYATQTGWWNLSDAETARSARVSAARRVPGGGRFLGRRSVGDFSRDHGARAAGTRDSDLAETDSVMHVLYDIEDKDRTFIPGTRHLRRGPAVTVRVYQPEGSTPAWRAMYDDRGHMVVAVNFNTDVGDAWEYADSPIYPEQMTALAYRYGINYLIYSMTH